MAVRPVLTFALTLALFALLAAAATPHQQPTRHRIGVGKGDITGPAGEVVMMGYGAPEQRTAGVLNRLHARAFIVEDVATQERVVFVNCDLQAVFQLVHQEVVHRLADTYGGVYSAQNVVLHATHTHAGPGGSSAYFLYDFCIFGFVDDNFNAIVSGILKAIDEAHNSLAPGTVRFSKGTILNGGKNRSPDAYNANPQAERDQYASDHDTDLRLLQFRDAGERLRGVLAFYPVHPTSLSKHNRLISGDNKGFAEFLLEDQFPGVVAGVGISNAGDVSPNLIDNGDGTFRGEGATDVDSAEIIGRRQADKVVELLATLDEPFAHRTCPGLLGQNFGAGTEDGRAFAGLREGDLAPHRFFRAASHAVQPTPPWLQQCHLALKVPLLATGLMAPATWTPEVLPVQVVRIGQVALAAASFELSTMAGRRVRATVQNALKRVGVTEVEVASISNAYAQYVTTKEEYLLQHYEGASTLFGPNQLAALQQELARVAGAVADPRVPLAVGPVPRQFDPAALYSFHLPVVLDSAGWGAAFGDLRQDAARAYRLGATVRVAFHGAHPRNRFPEVASFCDVEVERPSGVFEPLLTDAHWDVRFIWERRGLSESNSVCEWLTRAGRTAPGRYRIRHRGFFKSLTGALSPYEGLSSSFFVAASASNETASVC
ncbi:hypothetical protein PybrP1_003286 [[Pythium] brassicae (nom. inval.)]|nr:hypothetical protein PybrP1_003286 [[Pythium] brassicae (nom. inval.)]